MKSRPNLNNRITILSRNIKSPTIERGGISVVNFFFAAVAVVAA